MNPAGSGAIRTNNCYFRNMSMPSPLQKVRVILLAAGMIAAGACSSEPTKKARTPNQAEECVVWSSDDSAAMEVVHIANAYLFNDHHDKAAVLFRHAATMPHDLPGIAMNAGLLTRDTLSAKRYFRMEIGQDRRILGSALPDCRKYEFLVTMYRCYHLLGEPEKADSIARHYRMIDSRAAPSEEVLRSWTFH